MPQTAPGVTTEVVNATSLQEQINLSASGNMVAVGNPGGPVVFATYGRAIVPALAGSVPRSIVNGK